MRKQYLNLISTLKTLDEKQLIELFHDILSDGGKIADIERIGDCAYSFVANYEEDDNDEPGISEYQEAFEIDNARRLRDMK